MEVVVVIGSMMIWGEGGSRRSWLFSVLLMVSWLLMRLSYKQKNIIFID
jgi:hypothetical protein